MKRCPRCDLVKDLEAFAKRRGEGRQSYCLDCVRVYQRGRPRVLLAKRVIREAKNRPCADCGVQYPYYVMDFDHRPGCVKRANFNVLVKKGVARDILLDEIEKCDVVCSNCHRLRTYQRKRQALEAGESKDPLL